MFRIGLLMLLIGSWFVLSTVSGSDEEMVPKGRLRRAVLSLPDNTSCKITLSLSMPISPLNNTFSSMNVDLPFRFVLPTYTQLNSLYSSLGRIDDESDGGSKVDYDFLEEQRSNKQRRLIYSHLESMFENLGFDGSQCLRRAICELAEAPLGHHGLLGKLVHLIFSPSLLKIPKAMNDYLTSNRIRRQAAATDELNSELDLLDKPIKDEYTEAYTNGRNKGGCLEQYSCPISLFTPIHLHS